MRPLFAAVLLLFKKGRSKQSLIIPAKHILDINANNSKGPRGGQRLHSGTRGAPNNKIKTAKVNKNPLTVGYNILLELIY
jgi:hypothetical protein